MPLQNKICSKCKKLKPITEFSKSKSNRDGLKYQCKSCMKASAAKYRANNSDKVKAYQDKYYADNSDKARAYKAKYYADNYDKVKARHAKYYAENKEKVKAYNAKWQAENPDKSRIIRLNRRARIRKAGGKLSPDLAEKLYKRQRGKCVCCGKPLGKDYHMDHIMPLALGGTNTDNNMQLLRPQCNRQKHTKHPIKFMQERGFLL